MRHTWIDGRAEAGSPPARKMRATVFVGLLGVALFSIALAACGGTVQGQRQQARGGVSATSTPPLTPTPSPTRAPTPSPSPKPQPSPTAVPQPPQPPLAPPFLDVRPSSMSIVGHLDCTRTTVYVCQAAVIAEASNQRSLRWVASTSVPGGHIGFSPASGVLAPGQRVLVTISVPTTDCAPGLFIFQGPANTHTISWAC